MRQKRIEGTLFAELKPAAAANNLRATGASTPASQKSSPWPKSRAPPGNMAVLVNATRPGLKTLEDVIAAGPGG